ncbi:MAG: ATP-binding protein, partial [Halapricum sp.]
MTSYQSELGEGEGIAEELAESQRSISIAEFFEKNKHMLGFDSEARALVTAVKEAVDNALDACEEAGIAPDVYVEIEEAGDYYRLVVEDNGPGITKAQIPKIFGKLLYGSRFHKREQSLTPDQRVLVRRKGSVESIPIGVLCDAYLPDGGAADSPIPDGIQVPSFDRESHEMSWQPVTRAIRHETNERTYEITTEKGRTVEVTGNHSLFSLTKDGKTREVAAGDLAAGDVVLAPRTLPAADGVVESLNLLDLLEPDVVADRRIYVYGFDTETLAQIRDGETVRKKPSPQSDRRRTYFRYKGVDVLKDSLETNYLEEGYLPVETVLELGWAEIAEAQDCQFRTYEVGGEETSIPVALTVNEDLMKLLAYYVSEGHAGQRQVGFTFGPHEGDLIETTERALAGVGSESTTVHRQRQSTRVKAFGTPLALALERACGGYAQEKHIPDFVFDVAPEYQRAFIQALYEGDGSDSHPSNELSHTTTSETLARQLSILWNMQGVLASTEIAPSSSGYADEPSTQYRTKVYGSDIETLKGFDRRAEPGEQGYKRIPTAVYEDVHVCESSYTTVPDSIPGLLMGAGVGSSLEHAATYRSLIECAFAGGVIDKPRYAHNLAEMGLLDEDGRKTRDLEALWTTIQELHGLTDSDVCLLPVRDVTETEPPEFVYDISVPGATGYDENFVVSNDGPHAVNTGRGQQGIG